MLRLASDEDVHGPIIEGLLRQIPPVDIVRAVDVGLDHTPDPLILEWMANHGRVLITGDVNTMVGFAWERVRNKQPMPGVLALTGTGTIGQIIDDIVFVAEYYTEDEMKDMGVLYIPLK